MKYVRNFTIIAHIDHGKSTLADRLIQIGVDIKRGEDRDRMLDNMDLEIEKGITIKSQTARLKYHYKGNDYILNLIDTPGHVDFNYEVQRSLYACEGSVLLVDATSGIQAQTLKNAMLAIGADHEIIVAINKIDMPNADIERVKKQIENLIGIDRYCEISAKTGQGVTTLIEHIIEGIKPPKGDIHEKFQGFILDSWYDKYLGIIMLIRSMNGSLKKGDVLNILNGDNSNNLKLNAFDIGYLEPSQSSKEIIQAGDIFYMVTRYRNAMDINIGDTICLADHKNDVKPIFDDFVKTKQVVFCVINPIDNTVFEDLLSAAEQLRLNDSSFTFARHHSHVLGMGLRCGFLGILHMEVIVERLQREFNVNIIVTAPSVEYIVNLKNGNKEKINDPATWPETQLIDYVEEPCVNVRILSPTKYIGDIIELCKTKRGVQQNVEYVGSDMIIMEFIMPLSSIITDMHDSLQSITQGYGSFDYDKIHYIQGNLVRVDIKVNHEIVDAFSSIIHYDFIESSGRDMCERLSKLIPRQQFNIPIQAVINGSKIIARSDVRPYRKDVTAKCYGGDITRKQKLLNKQKKGKEKMITTGRVKIPNKVVLDFIRGQK